ncbi:7292_t:CDS:2 [Diversispora eburnea]|uniref:7292_t:CDS:1 n=1 Tax=Diversispora eburnea TaxID=1213867 RepID=A0A9N8ZJG0_9GLOM|nr:7292_t:CDS:2 [Diversispora eburnea]
MQKNTPSSIGAYIPASLVQNILGWHEQALETISDQVKTTRATQEENICLRQKIDKLEKELLSLKHNYLIRHAATGEKSEISMDLDERISKSIDIDIDHIDKQENFTEHHQNPRAFRFLSSSTSIAYENVSSGLTQTEWTVKYSELKSKYDKQMEEFQAFKEHYAKRSVEWKRFKKWILKAKPELIQSHTEKEIMNGASRSNTEINSEPPEIDNKTKICGALTDITNVQKQVTNIYDDDNDSIIDINNINNTSLCSSNTNNDDNQISFQTFSSDFDELSSTSNDLENRAQICNRNLDFSMKNKNYDSQIGTNFKNPIDVEKYDNWFYSDDEVVQKSNRKRSVDMVNKLESRFPSSVNNKKCKQIFSKEKESEDLTLIQLKTRNDDESTTEVIICDDDIEEMELPATSNTSFNKKNKNKCDSEPNYRIIEASRKKSDRCKWKGEDCRDCHRFYKVAGPLPLPDSVRTFGYGHDNNDQEQSPELLIEAHMQHVSRHRTLYSRPLTPPGFWEVDFPTTQRIGENQEKTKEYSKKREEQKRKEQEYEKDRERKWKNTFK